MNPLAPLVLQGTRLQAQSRRGPHDVLAGGGARAQAEIVGKLEWIRRDAVGAAPVGASAGTTASPGTLPPPTSLPPGATLGRPYGNRRVEPKSVASQAAHSGAASGLKFTGGIGVPTNRATLEGALSPYQQPNGNTGAATSGKLTNGIEAQGMHFGLEWRY
jgi:hypothetical protein